MNGALGALESAVTACGEQRDVCSEQSDASAGSSCQDAFRACKDEAIAQAMPELERGVNVCAEASRSCRDAAASSDERRACAEQLKSCVADSSGPADEEAGDAEASEEQAAPVAGCIAALRVCIESDEDAKLCTDQLRTCLSTALPNRGDRDDGGAPEDDEDAATEPESDGGTSQDPIQLDDPDAGAAPSCKDQLNACVETGKARKDCARELATCKGGI